MTQPLCLYMELIDPAWLADHAHGTPPRWCHDGDPVLSAEIALRNSAIEKRLMELNSTLAPAKDILELEEYADDALDQEAVLRRYHRCRILWGRWRHGEIAIRIFDQTTEVTFIIAALSAGDLPLLEQSLKQTLAEICAATGMTPWNGAEARAEESDSYVKRSLELHAVAIKRHVRSAHIGLIRHRLALPAIILSGMMAFAFTALFATDIIHDSQRLSGVEEGQPRTFITETTLPVTRRLLVFPKFTLQGHIEGESASFILPVFRDEFLRAGPGAPYIVLPTANPDTPYVLRSAYENSKPLLRFGSWGVQWQIVMTLIPAALWYLYCLHPLLTTTREQRQQMVFQLGRRANTALLLGAGFAAILLLA